ncbi:hypothetical protein DV517_32180 [Streptomyces sp. S816]|nr:hypothetical protein DV517_32180 [Streptomyces sp. S816]
MHDRPSLEQAGLPQVVSHASRGGSTFTGFRHLRATPVRAQLRALRTPFALI